MAPSLRGSLSAISPETTNSSRTLQQDAHHDNTWLMQAIVAMIALFFAVSLHQFIYSRCRKYRATRAATAADTSQVKVFALSENQRRAVLEAIYADNSKPAKELGVAVRNKSCEAESDAIPIMLQIPSLNLKASFDKASSGADLDFTCIEISLSSDSILYLQSRQSHDDDPCESLSLSCFATKEEPAFTSDKQRVVYVENQLQPPDDDVEVYDRAEVHVHDLGNQDHASRVMRVRHHDMEEGNDCSVEPSTPVSESAVSDSSVGATEAQTQELLCLECGQATPFGELNDDQQVASDYSSDDMLQESVKPKHGELPSTKSSPNSFAAYASEFAYEDDASCATGDNVWYVDMCAINLEECIGAKVLYLCFCNSRQYSPICLSGYVTKDVLIMSKHCTHVFHKVRIHRLKGKRKTRSISITNV